MRRHQTAYSLLEVLIALAILSTSGFALFDLLNNQLINYQQQQQASQQLQNQYTLLTLASLVNPTITDKESTFRDTESIGSLSWNWEAITIEEQQARGYSSGLYSVRIQQDTRLVPDSTTQLELIKMGSQRQK